MLIKLILENYIPLLSSGITKVELDLKHMVNLFIAQNGTGKGQTLSSKIRIPGGWTTMGKIKKGDKVIARDGSTATVTGVFPQGIKPVYRVHFVDGRYTDVDNTHLWKVFDSTLGVDKNKVSLGDDRRWSVINTEELIKLRELHWKQGNVYIPLIEPEDCDDKEFKIHPYVMGVLLGDGGLTGSNVNISKPYQELFDKIQRLLPDHLECRWGKNNVTFAVCYKQSKTESADKWHLRTGLKEDELMGLKSHEKFIPSYYFEGSRQQRLELLQGLLDTDGTIGAIGDKQKPNGRSTVQKSGNVSFSSSSEKLSLGVQYLVRSLGGIARIIPRPSKYTYNGEKKEGRTDYRVSIRYPRPEELFTLEHKRKRANKGQYSDSLKLKITRIEERHPEPTQCISIDHPEHLYVTDDFIVTHNTSLLMEMNPLPPENGNYRAGRKYVELKVGPNHYVLDSKTGVGDGHTFKLNGVNLNKGGTYSAQKELVWQHFKLDTNRSRVLSGVKLMDLFSNMPINRRKEVMMWLYPNDTDYGMSVYNKLRTERNELKAVIKNQISRYADENRKLEQITECGTEELENRIKAIDDELRQSLLVRGSLEQFKLDPDLQQKVNQFNQLTEQMTVNKVSGFFDTEQELLETLDVTQELLSVHKEQAAVLQQVISEHASVLEGMEEFLEDPLIFHHQAEQLTAELTELKTQVERYDVQLNQYPVFNDKEQTFKGLEHVYDAFVAQLHRVTLASTQDLTGGRYKDFTNRYEVVANQLRETQGKLTGVVHQLKHYDSMELVNCPDCSHEFKVGVTEAEIVKLREMRTALEQAVIRLEKEREVLKDKIDNDAEWYESMMALYQFCQFNQDVPCLVTLVKEYGIGKSETSILLNALRSYMGRFDVLKRSKALLEEQDLLNTRIGLLQRDNVLDTAQYINGLETSLQNENKRVTFYQRKLQSLQAKLATLRNYNNDLNRLSTLKGEILKGLENEGLLHLRKQVDERISLLTDEKDDYLTSIIKSRSLTAVVTSISEDIERLKRRLSIVETWMDGLCPNKGLIGRLMTDFIKTFCGNMNAVIQSVWNTPLYVKPCNKANGDLTYKFPVVNGDGEPAPDISNCSLGQTGIIDFAFRYVALSYHGSWYPLIMDEVGTTLDEIKRGRFFNFVKEISQKKDTRQLMLVSHYINQIGIFSNPNIVAMRYEGLSMPAEPNKHSVIT